MKTEGNEQVYGYGFSFKQKNPNFGRGDSQEYFEQSKEVPGLTKREYFAAMAMQGMLNTSWHIDDVPKKAVQMADTLINALNQKDNGV